MLANAAELLLDPHPASRTGEPTFVGVGRKADVDRYLAGSVRPARPAAQRFWAESAGGKGVQTISWKIREGQWRVVVMNADGSPGVTADAKVGASVAHALVYSLVLLGLALAIGALALLLVRSPRAR